ncbi:hypothetical protein ACFQGT_09765 [Natrialbaceae archaeon GCM10025810]|uniref:hypothetical protein n=1 Tax=Halovalidus salilacus TaxID=3075124 RepID=UPI00361C3561
MAVAQQTHTEVELPRDVSKYRHTTHSYERYKDTKRMVHEGIIREAIEEGELELDEKRDGYMKFKLEWSVFRYEIVVSSEPDSDGIYPIVTIYHNFTKCR